MDFELAMTDMNLSMDKYTLLQYNTTSELCSIAMSAIRDRKMGTLMAVIGQVEGGIVMNIILLILLVILLERHTRDFDFRKKKRASKVLVSDKKKTSLSTGLLRLPLLAGKMILKLGIKLFFLFFVFLVMGIKIHQVSSNVFGNRQEKTYHDAVIDQVIDPMRKIGFSEAEAWNVINELGLGTIPDLKSSLLASVDAFTQSGVFDMQEMFPKILQFWTSKALVILNAVAKNQKIINHNLYGLAARMIPRPITYGIETLTGKGIQNANFQANMRILTSSAENFIREIVMRKVADIMIMLVASFGLALLVASAGVFPDKTRFMIMWIPRCLKRISQSVWKHPSAIAQQIKKTDTDRQTMMQSSSPRRSQRLRRLTIGS